MGARVQGVYAKWVTGMSHRNIAYLGIAYPARPVPVVSGAVTMPAFILTGDGPWRDYFSGIDQGVRRAESYLNFRSFKCPKEHYVLAGYSQGSLVLHRMVFDVDKRARPLADDLLPRIDAVVTLADPDRVAHDDVVIYGTSGTGDLNWGIGLKSGPVNNAYAPTTVRLSSVSPAINTRWLQVCDRGDLVCDSGLVLSVAAAGTGSAVTYAAIANGYRVHTTHYGEKDAGLIKAAARAAKFSMNARPLRTTFTGGSGVVGMPYAGAITVTSGFDLTTVSLTSGSLPPGLNLAVNGQITGAPTAAGTWTFAYRATDRALQTSTGTGTIAIAETPPITQTVSGDKMRIGQSSNAGIWVDSPSAYVSSIVVTGGQLPPGITINPYLEGGCESTIGCTFSGRPMTVGAYSFSYDITMTDGSHALGSTTFTVYDVPTPSVSVTDVQSSYVSRDSYGRTNYYVLTIKVTKTQPGSTSTISLTDREDPASDGYEYLSGDSNANGKVDVGETWTFSGFIPMDYVDTSSGELTRTIVINGNDDTGAPGYQESTFAYRWQV